MSYSLLTSKLFKLTSLTCALALAGCGGGDDTVDSITPAPDLGVQPGTGGDSSGNNGGNNDGEQTPDIKPDFSLQVLTVEPSNIELSDKPTTFTVTVKAIQSSSAAMSGEDIRLQVEPSANTGAITIEGPGTLITNSKGEAVYELKLNPQAVKDEAALLKEGFTLTASATKADGTIIKQVNTVPVYKKGSGDGTQVVVSKLSVKSNIKTSSVSNGVLNPFGDTGTFSVEVKDEKGALVPDVTVGLGIMPLDGVSISPASRVTDSKGIAVFNIKIDDNLSPAARKQLLKGITYTINIQEKNGATKSLTNSLKVALPVSDYNLDIKGNSNELSAYGDTQSLTITATAKNINVPTKINGAKATIKLNSNIDGVSLNTEQLTLDAKGQANVVLAIAPTLDAAARTKLAKDGIGYTVTVTEPNRSVTTKTSTSTVDIPDSKYTISFNESSKKELSSSGGSAVISFRVNDKRGGVIANQKVVANLPSDLAKSGLLTLESSAEQTTNGKGEVSYIVRVPKNLTDAKKIQLEKAGVFVLIAIIEEASGASSTVKSESIRIGSDIGQSDIKLTAKSVPTIVSVLDEQFKLQVTGKRKNGSAADGRLVKLIITKGDGVTIVGNEQTTDKTGIATFTMNIDQNLTPVQRSALIKSGIGYTAILTDEDGTQSRVTQTIKVEQPVTGIQFASIITPTISELGGTGNVNVKLTTKASTSQPIKNQSVTIKLAGAAQTYGITVAPSTQQTDFNGEATFVVKIPEGLTLKQRTELKNKGISYQLSYVEKGITYDAAVQKIAISTPTVAFSILNATSNIDNRAGYLLNAAGDTVTVQAQLNNQTDKSQIANQSVNIKFDNQQLARFLTVNGQIGSANISAITDKNGTVSFEVVVPSNLSKAERAAFNKQILTAMLTETLTGKQQQVKIKVQSMVSAISLIAGQSKALNLNGGETQIEVTAKDNDGNIVAGQKVFLALPAVISSQGVTLVSDGSQTTDDSGRATFTIAVPNNLTVEQKKSIGSSFAIVLSAADANNNIVTQTSRVTTVAPSANGTQESLTIGANKVVDTKGDTFKVFVRLANDSRAINGRTVRLNVDEPIKTGVTIANGTATTNSDGVAIFDLTLEKGANVNQALLKAGIRLTATTTTAENTELKQNYIVAVDTATIDSYQILVTSDKATLNTGGDQTTATFRVTDSSGGILAGVPVQLSIENLEASGAALTTPSMVTTDANGTIDVGILLAANTVNSRLNHSVVINAKIVTPQYDADGKASMQVREEKSLNLSAIGTQITLAASKVNLKDGETTTVTTTLIDGAGRAIANAGMELIDINDKIIATNAITTTNTNGEASFDIRENNLTFDSNGNLRIFARAVGESTLVTQRSVTSIDLVKVSQAGISFINIEDIYNVDKPQEIQIQIRADNATQANALIGKRVELQTSLGSLITNYLDKFNDDVIVTKPIKASDIQGNVITVKVWLKSQLAGTAVLQAKVLGENLQNGQPRYQTTVDTRFRATTPTKMLFQAVKSVITPGTSTEVIATVKDKNDVPVEGQTVVFSRVADSSAGRLSAATAVTDRRGEARVVYQANASSPIGGVVINARLLNDNAGIGTKTTNITVSKEAVYTTLAFSNKLSSDTIYYTVQGSISVMDGSGRAVPNKEVSVKSYAIEYAQGKVCLLDSTTTYQKADEIEKDDKGNVIKVVTPEPKVFSEQTPTFLQSGWKPTEDPEYNYTLDKNADLNSNGSLDPINPVAIIGGILSDDSYTFVTDKEGRADFEIRYPMRYSNWVKVRFDATTFLNGSESTQSINYRLPSLDSDLSINGSTIMTPWTDNASPFGDGGATCASSMNVIVDDQSNKTKVILSPYEQQRDYFVSINGESPDDLSVGYNSFIVDFNKAFELGSTINVNSNGFEFYKTIRID